MTSLLKVVAVVCLVLAFFFLISGAVIYKRNGGYELADDSIRSMRTRFLRMRAAFLRMTFASAFALAGLLIALLRHFGS